MESPEEVVKEIIHKPSIEYGLCYYCGKEMRGYAGNPNLAKLDTEKIKKLMEEIEKLRGERCYICRQDDPKASDKGCKDCEEKSGLHHTVVVLDKIVDILKSELNPAQLHHAGKEIKKFGIEFE